MVEIPLAVADRVVLESVLARTHLAPGIRVDVTASKECDAIGVASQLTNLCRNDLIKPVVPKLPETI